MPLVVLWGIQSKCGYSAAAILALVAQGIHVEGSREPDRCSNGLLSMICAYDCDFHRCFVRIFIAVSGSIKQNLDPFAEHDDATIWNALERAQVFISFLR